MRITMSNVRRRLRYGLYTAMAWCFSVQVALAYSFSSGGGGGYGGLGSSGMQPGGGTNINGVVQNADTTVLLAKGLTIDVATLVGFIVAAMGIYRITKDKERGENHHTAAFKMILAGGALASLGVLLMTTVNGIYT